VRTRVIGGSHIMNKEHIDQLEAALPNTHQCYDWKLLYRLTRDGASLNTMLLNAANHTNTLLVIRDSKGAVFGGFITEHLKGGILLSNIIGGVAMGAHSHGGATVGSGGTERYYGNGTVAVWTFVTGALQVHVCS
jgi:TLD